MTSADRVRFAPSPTGRLHVGNLRTAIANWLAVKASGGDFLLRLDDTDTSRSTEESAQSIREDLAWLGIAWSEEHRQSDRGAAYEAAGQKLVASGRLYPCYETPQELDVKRKIQLSRGQPPVYDRAALALTDAQKAALEADGLQPHWRFKLETETKITLTDKVQGEFQFDPASTSDPVVRRADGSWLYMLPSVVDDIDMAITLVVRGADHLGNSAIQTQMFEALGANAPQFAHLGLLSMKDQALSKRLGSSGVDHYRAIGVEPISILAYLARLGTSDPIQPMSDPAELVASFDWGKFNKANAMFDEAELMLLNSKVIHQLPFAAVADRVPAGVDESVWAALKGNLETVGGLPDLWQIITGPITPVIEEADYISAAREALEPLEWSGDIWTAWTSVLKEKTGRKGKALFMPLRLALTGQPHGPEMGPMMQMMGRAQALARLQV